MSLGTTVLLELLGRKVQLLYLYEEYSIVETSQRCPKCGANIICFHARRSGCGPINGRPYTYDIFLHVCFNEICNFIEEKMEDTEDGLAPPKNCLIKGCSRVIGEEIKNRSQN